MKVTVNEVATKKEELTYPVLMQVINDGLVVLFVSDYSGVVVVGDSDYKKGSLVQSFCDARDKRCWKKFEGTITLEND